MLIHVNRARCEGHGQCEDAAPEVYAVDDDGMVALLHGEKVPTGLESAAAAGACACPVMALTVEES